MGSDAKHTPHAENGTKSEPLGPNHADGCDGTSWKFSGSGYGRVRVCSCGAEDHSPENAKPEPLSAEELLAQMRAWTDGASSWSMPERERWDREAAATIAAQAWEIADLRGMLASRRARVGHALEALRSVATLRVDCCMIEDAADDVAARVRELEAESAALRARVAHLTSVMEMVHEDTESIHIREAARDALAGAGEGE